MTRAYIRVMCICVPICIRERKAQARALKIKERGAEKFEGTGTKWFVVPGKKRRNISCAAVGLLIYRPGENVAGSVVIGCSELIWLFIRLYMFLFKSLEVSAMSNPYYINV